MPILWNGRARIQKWADVGEGADYSLTQKISLFGTQVPDAMDG